MANVLEEQGNDKCFRFNDGTKPISGAKGQLGHLCRPCRRQDQAAQALFDNETPQARRMLLRQENQNLRMVRTLTTIEHQAEASATEAWRVEVAKTAERDMLLGRRRSNEENQE